MYPTPIDPTPRELALLPFLRALTRGQRTTLLRGLAEAAEDSRQNAWRCDPKGHRAREYQERERLLTGMGDAVLALHAGRDRC